MWVERRVEGVSVPEMKGQPARAPPIKTKRRGRGNNGRRVQYFYLPDPFPAGYTCNLGIKMILGIGAIYG